jgi:hypothetical protein
MDMHWLRKKFNDFVLENVNIESLIRLSDKEKDRVITPKAMRRLISVSQTHPYPFPNRPI